MTLRIAFIGSGAMAGNHLRALSRVPTAHAVVGVCDARASAAQAFARAAGSAAYATLAELFAEARPDVVHVCTPAGTHFEPARQALLAGAHVYVEKPFVETRADAEALFDLARQRGLSICAGHQQIRDPAFDALMRRAAMLRPVALIDSYFAFRPPRLDPIAAPRRALAAQLLDVLPHPLYSLVAALETVGRGVSIDLVSETVTPTELHALLSAGDVTGRLTVSLRARPVASTLTISGVEGSLTADFARAIVLGAANPGTSPLEKIANPFLEAGQLAWRSAGSLARRLLSGGHYPGLVELISDFYAAVAAGEPSPVSVQHLRRVTAVYEQLAAQVRATAASPGAVPVSVPSSTGPLVVVTGAAGFFGRAITRALGRRGYRVRGIGRSQRPDDLPVDEWIRLDLAGPIDASAFAGAEVVVHAAAETAGGFDEHARNTVGATREVLRAMAAAQVRQMVYVSSISVLRPPHWFREVQSERTPMAALPVPLGPYTWGKCAAEEVVAAAQRRGDIEARILRPAALIDWDHLELPGLLGRRLFGRWHLGLGRPRLPFAAVDVGRAAAVVAWSAAHFTEAPPIVNLVDPALPTRRHLLTRFREHGWRGRVVWVPISLLAAGVTAARFVAALLRRQRARPLAVWSILRPRRYDPTLSATVLHAAREDLGASRDRDRDAVSSSGVYG